MPEVPKKIPEEKVPIAVPRKPEPPPAKGMLHYEQLKFGREKTLYLDSADQFFGCLYCLITFNFVPTVLF